MANKRVHEIAKAHGVPSKDLLDALQADGHDVSTASSSVDEAVAARSIKAHASGGAPSSEAKKPAAAPARPVRPAAPGTGAPARPQRPVRPPAPGQRPAAPA
ncbi:translation initiation factor IF-2 N-terminal domain-containing protein, partial [Patulibacter medicamentivorans]|uniref:translation initiation factor IF-2 N-terminal domain-containing protein n=1 Tax=Patulibacter medicamentivorans TaxID=1097667 RepID=UPI0014795F93